MANEEIPQIIDVFNKQLNFDSSRQLADTTNEPNGNYLHVDENNSNGMYTYQVGYCYYLGIGVEIDKHKAFTYYLKSAEAGNSMGIWKTAWCYYYGIGAKKNLRKWREWIDKWSKYGKCAHCNEDNTQPAWCLSCDPDVATRWTSRNKDIDDCMKTFQLRANRYEDVIEWIPFDKLSDVKKIGKGGFGSVYSATWLDGIRKVKTIKDGDNDIYKRVREQSSTVALKTLASSIENNKRKTMEYLVVFQYANNGSLSKYLRNNFCNLTWQTKLEILKNISDELENIHSYAKYIHADFHSGNILQDQQSYIADLGLSRKSDEKVLEGVIYGVMPYVAPEVLSEMTTGQRPFDGRNFDLKLSVDICKGLRPEFAPETPNCYVELAKKCMDADLQKWPNAWVIYCKISDWLKNIASSNDDNEIKKQFLEADKVIKALPISRHPDEMYTSKIISTKLISKAIKGIYLFSINILY
ncbi:kinase-like domain-containing protein [Gigaspora rosea]|uniref:Kinase-like domain-containing protein n=1 Tax=Gigaspora rosea TaxID=44941 RepID=A0A397UEF3_9GLOM|nr:kinase-like domain-containing protein [Gigaspora rosea]